MQEEIQIHIELEKGYLKKFLEYQLEDTTSLSSSNFYGAAILNILRTDSPFKKPKQVDETRTITVKVKWYSRFGVAVTKQQAKLFSSLVETHMKKEFIQNCETSKLYGSGEIKDVITDFMAKYDLYDEDISPNALRKWWQRSTTFKELAVNQ